MLSTLKEHNEVGCLAILVMGNKHPRAPGKLDPTLLLVLGRKDQLDTDLALKNLTT